MDMLTPIEQTEIKSHVYKVLGKHVNQGEYGSIWMKILFMEVLQSLVDAKVIERPEWLGGSSAGGQRVDSFIKGPQDKHFPDYDLPPNVASLIRQTFWELFVQGVLAPGASKNPLAKLDRSISPPPDINYWTWLDAVMITPYGAKVLVDTQKQILVHDPDEYLANFQNSSPLPDDEMMRYLKEGVAVFRHAHFLACIVLLGVASERLIDVLADNLSATLKDKGKWHNEKYKYKQISKKFEAIDGKLMGEYGSKLAQEDLKDPFQNIVKLTFEQIRLARNDIAHPQGREFTWNETNGFLHSFVQYYKIINQINAFLLAMI